MARAGVIDEEMSVRGHKVFVTTGRDGIVLEAVNDDRPLVRMRFLLDEGDAREIASMLWSCADEVTVQ